MCDHLEAARGDLPVSCFSPYAHLLLACNAAENFALRLAPNTEENPIAAALFHRIEELVAQGSELAGIPASSLVAFEFGESSF